MVGLLLWVPIIMLTVAFPAYLMGKSVGLAAIPKPVQKWLYLGQSEYNFHNTQTNITVEVNVVHFWCLETDHDVRKITHTKGPCDAGEKDRYGPEKHSDYARNVQRWLNGDNIYIGITAPSTALKKMAKDDGYEWVDAKTGWRKIGASPSSDPARDDLIDAIMKEKEK